MLSIHRFLMFAEKIQSVDKIFLRDFMLILSPLLFYFGIEGVFSASTAYFLPRWCQVIDLFL
jgi:hypothetical protein